MLFHSPDDTPNSPESRLDWFRLALDKVEGVLRTNAVDGARLVPERHAVALVRDMNDLGTERSADELRADFV